MDKKSTVIGVSLLVLAIVLLVWRTVSISNDAQKPGAANTAAVAAPASTNAQSQPVAPPPPAPAPAPAAAVSAVASAPAAPAPALKSLSNDTLRLSFSHVGGGIANVALLNQADAIEHRRDTAAHPYLFNTVEGATPALALTFRYNNTLWTPNFVVSEATADSVTLTAPIEDPVSKGTVLVTRKYTLTPSGAKGGEDPHVIKVATTFRVTNDKAFGMTSFQMNLGTLPPTEGDYAQQFLGVATYDGDTFSKATLSDFTGSGGFFGLGKSDAKLFEQKSNFAKNWKWASVTNQYFAAILQFDDPANRSYVSDLLIRPIMKANTPLGQLPVPNTATGDLGFAIPALGPGQEVTLTASYYVGLREYARLAALGHEQEKAVHFAKLWFISMDFLCKIFVVLLGFLHNLTDSVLSTGAWALAIILLTVLIKALTWPLVTAQQRSAEKMRKFSGPMKAIREKYKDDPKRQQMETMKLYQEHKINPLAGCIPVLIQIPIFSGLFFTFQSLAQLRFQSFLWITDLSMPDTIPGLEDFHLPFLGVPIHILPLFMGVSMLVNMKLMPMPNVEGQQKMIFYGMMILFPVICYSMPSALMLYYSVQNVLTILQTLVTRRRMRAEEAASAIVTADGTVVLPAEKPKSTRGKGKFRR